MTRSSKKSIQTRTSSKSIMQDDDGLCYVCGYPLYSSKDKHHIFNAAYRNKAEEDGCYIFVHRVCHQWLHDHPKTNLTFKRRGQKAWMQYYGKSLEDFMERYGKNYDNERESGTASDGDTTDEGR